MKAKEALKTEGKKADRASFPVMLDQGLWVHHIVKEKRRIGIRMTSPTYLTHLEDQKEGHSAWGAL